MSLLQRLRILVVADAAGASSLLAVLRQIECSIIIMVESPAEARRLCAAGAADACLLLVQDSRPDEVVPLSAECAAPGRDSGIPSLLVVDVVTPYLKRAARRSGYVRTVAVATGPRLLYRTISAALQHARQEGKLRCRSTVSRDVAASALGFARKATLH
jgi:hypothetical protein